MSKHTPGPWYQVGAWVEVEDDKTPDICTCNPADIGQDHLKWDWETVKANARLIAAAPDLLKALQKFVKRNPHDNELTRAARAAIAKATGEKA